MLMIIQLVDLSAAQDVEAGDGTTSVVVLCSSMLSAAEKMLNKGNKKCYGSWMYGS